MIRISQECIECVAKNFELKGMWFDSDSIHDAIFAHNTQVQSGAIVVSSTGMSDWGKMLAWAHENLAHRKTEAGAVAFLHRTPRGLHFQAAEILFEGDDDTVSWDNLDKVLQKVKEYNSHDLVIMHNHPTPHTAAPSSHDLDFTGWFKFRMAAHNIRVHDHIVVNKFGDASVKLSHGI